MSAYLSTQNSVINNLRLLSQGATTTKELSDAIESHNKKGDVAAGDFYFYSSIALPILGIVLKYTDKSQVAILAVPLTVFTVLQTKFYYNKADHSWANINLHKINTENILRAITNYMNEKRIAKETVLIDKFNSYKIYCYNHEKESFLESRKIYAKNMAQDYDITKPVDASKQLAWQEHKEAVSLACTVLNLQKTNVISENCWDDLRKSCQWLINGRIEAKYGEIDSYIRIDYEPDSSNIVAIKF